MKKITLLARISILIIGILFSINTFSQSQNFTSSGSFVVPAGVTSIDVSAWGAGGGGSDATQNGGGRRGGGGGGGAYASSTITVIPGNSYTVTIGNGGPENTDGGSSSFEGSLVVAAGGSGAGAGGPNPGNTTTGAAGGTAAASTGTITYSGGNGADGGSTFSGGGGGGAGSTGAGIDATGQTGGSGTTTNGGNGADGVSEINGNNGNTYGGGGSGGATTTSDDRNGGSGANGLVVISWTLQPEINILGASNNIVNDPAFANTPTTTNDTDFGIEDITSGSNSNMFTIENTGVAPLTLTGGTLVAIGGANPGDFSVTINPLSSINPGNTEQFEITFDPTAVGLRTATVTIDNNDSDEDPYSFNIQGNGTTSVQTINIQGNGVNIPNGDNTPTLSDDRDFGNILVTSGTNVNTFTIQNLGTVNDLTLTDISPYVVISGTHAADFTITAIPSATITASTSTTFAITFDPSALGLRTATVSIGNNDINKDPFTFDIKGTGVIITAPGGVDTDLQLWLKSTQGLSYTDGQPVSLWQDQGNAVDATAPAVGLEPTYRDDPAYNINFNPVIDFDNDYTTAGEDYTFSDTNRNTLVGASGFYTQDIFMVTIPDNTVNSSFDSMDVFCGDRDELTDERDGTGIGFGRYSVRFEDEILSYAIGTSSSDSSTPIADRGYGIAHTGTTDNYSKAGIINSKNNDPTTPTANILYFNGNDVGNTEVGLPQFSNVSDSRYFLGRSEAYKGSFDGRICEIITYSSKKTDANPTEERNRIQSYLAIKYGITLGVNGISQNYVDGSGSLIWDQSDPDYNYDITGIGRDDISELNQKQSKSINVTSDGTDAFGPTLTNGILTIGLSDIYDTNNQNISTNPTSFSNGQYLTWGNNGEPITDPKITVLVDMSAGITGLSTPVTFEAMPRTWKVVEHGGNIGSCKVSIPKNAVRNITPPGSYLMFISSTGVFDPTADYRVMTEDANGNLETDYDFDSTKYITFGYAEQVIVERSVYFDGLVDYIDVQDHLDLNTTAFTISAWIKRDNGTINASILSKRDAAFSEGYDLRINNSGRLEFSYNGGAVTLTSGSVIPIPENEWHQVAVIYNSGTATLYIDGVADTSLTGLAAPVATTQSFLIAAADGYDPDTTAFFAGNIDEIRVWDTALSQVQLRYVMNQEISNDVTLALEQGDIIPTTITKNEISTVPWTDLAGYYPMSVYTYTNTDDMSGNNNQGALRNLDTVDYQTAPLPYQSEASGSWDNDATWLNNATQALPNSLSIVDNITPIDWNIVEINNNVTIDDFSTYGREIILQGLIVNSGNDLQLNGFTPIPGVVPPPGFNTPTGNALTVSHYLKLDGTLDLEGESQLIQSEGSELDVTSSGNLERDQQGTADTYTYNYWSSPVGLMNNTTNNNNYTVTDVFNNLNFLTSGYDGTMSPLAAADYWIWKFNNLPSNDYASWQHVRSTGTLAVGEGFTMKGPGSGSISTAQNYIFSGKPNNGNINLSISAGNDYLVGNPYPSAIDANQFILDNGATINGAGTTTGTLYFWEHWGGSSHNLGDYQGGYATYSLAGGTPAAAMGTNDPNVGTGGTPTITPGRFIPVAQGFFVTAEGAGTIQFNNGQRVFQTEGSASSVFSKSRNKKTFKTGYTDERPKIRLGFNSVNTLHRQLLITIDENTTSDYDWGYDALHNDNQIDDMYWMLDNDKYTIQGINEINEQTILPIGLHTRNDGLNNISIDKLENISNHLEIYVYDKELEVYHNLKESNYEVFLNSGEYLNRFEITFSNAQSLGVNDITNENLYVYFSNEKESTIIHNPNSINIKSLEIYNILGQSVFNNSVATKENYIEILSKNIKSGAYIIKVSTDDLILSKKVLIK